MSAAFKTKKPTNIINISKKFDQFETAYEEVIQLVPEISAYGGNESIYEAVVFKLLETVKNNIPSPWNTRYPSTYSMSINSHEVGFRSDSFLAFGWKIKLNRENMTQEFVFRVSFIELPKFRVSSFNLMLDKGWKLIGDKGYQSRFWNEVEGKKYIKTGEKNTNKEDTTI